ncbi:hypothetical protein C5F64_16120 [Photobacterium damselae subsp. damselae]|uniref:hypothetical protein n=1 Tax=Photobacterium damselae TaxID=38293 RepID=UPI000D07955C|nr:hypothetical protein [Photobacterium damselae]PSB82307.1 hypothetical protein C5F64_16120 [Photobacterium damselae subsp. damselae]
MVNFKKFFLLSCLFLFGCNNDETSTSLPVELPSPTQSVNIYATSAGNFGRAFMLSSAFSSNVSQTIMALGSGKLPYEFKSITGAEFKVIGLENKYENISNTVINNANHNKENNLYLGVIGISNGNLLSDEAFSCLDNIYIVPEGTSLLGYPEWRINNILSFAKKAKKNGVKNVNLALWNSIDNNKLLSSSAQIAKLPSNGVGYYFFNFNDMAKKVSLFDNSEGLLSAAIYTGAINPSIIDSDIFIESTGFDKDKESIVLFGSYTRNEINTSKTNQIEILKKLEKIVDHEKYNIIFKGHPSEVSVNNWIEHNPNISSASYFKSFPYEIWQVVGGGEHKYTYNDVSYNLYLPKVPKYIYSMFSTTLYGEDANKIKVIIGYNKVKHENTEYILTNEVDGSAIEDKYEYNRWADWTKNKKIPFEMTFDWIYD